MSKDESTNVNIEDAEAEEIRNTFNEMVTKYTELTENINSLVGKLTQQGILQEGMTVKSAVQQEKDYDIGMGEAMKSIMTSGTASWQANMKSLFDAYMFLNLESERRNRLHFDRMMVNSATNDKAKDTQELRHADIAAYKLWGLSPPTEYKQE